MTQAELFKAQAHSMPSQSAILVDMDGTLCHREGFTDRDPYDWKRAGEDGFCKQRNKTSRCVGIHMLQRFDFLSL